MSSFTHPTVSRMYGSMLHTGTTKAGAFAVLRKVSSFVQHWQAPPTAFDKYCDSDVRGKL